MRMSAGGDLAGSRPGNVGHIGFLPGSRQAANHPSRLSRPWLSRPLLEVRNERVRSRGWAQIGRSAAQAAAIRPPDVSREIPASCNITPQPIKI
jgi:hypothetical protein